MNPKKIYDVELEPQHFENDHNRALFKVIDYLAQQRSMDELEFDSMTLISYAKKFDEVMNALEMQFGDEKELIRYIESLRKYYVNPKNIDIHIDELMKADLINAINRNNKKLKEELLEKFDQLEVEEVAEKIENNALEITNNFTIGENQKKTRIGEGLMNEYMDREPNDKKFVGYPTPFPDLNEYSSGLLRKGSVTVINAKPKVGKSTIIKNIVKFLGIEHDIPVFWGVSEDDPKEQKDKIIAEMTGIDTTILENGIYNKDGNEEMKDKVMDAIKKIQDAPIFIEQIRGYTPQKLVRKARFYKKRHNIEVFAWDYVKRSTAFYSTDKPLRHWMGDVVNTLKENIADPLDLAVLTGSQAKTYDAFLPAESQDIARHCTAFVVLRELEDEFKKNRIEGKYGISIPYNRFGNKHDEPKSQFFPFKFDETELRFEELKR